MVKVLEHKYPMGSFPRQESPGRYMNEHLKANIDVMAEKIVDDLQFLGLCSSSTYEVRSGKSTFMQQIGEYYTDSVNRMHKLNLTFDMKNIVFNSADLMTRAFELPKYSCLIMDENDEIDEHYFSKLAKDLRRFFKKSGQLNLFIIIVVPNFFQLKSHYAITRSNFLIDVRFFGKFERGLFAFYSYERKRDLYLNGKKTQNFNVTKPDFMGRFTQGYAVDRQAYLEAKRIDLEKSEEPVSKPKETEEEMEARILARLKELHPEILGKSFGIAIGKSKSTANMRISLGKQLLEPEQRPII